MRRGNGSRIDRVTSQVTSHQTTVVTASAQLNMGLLPSNAQLFSAQVQAMSDLYRFYRVTRLEIEFCAPNTGGTSSPEHPVLVGYTPGNIVASTTTALETSALPYVAYRCAEQTTKERLIVGAKGLAGLVPWYQTQGLGATETDTQGFVIITVQDGNTGLAVASELDFLVRTTVEFKDLLPAALSLSRARASSCAVAADDDIPASTGEVDLTPRGAGQSVLARQLASAKENAATKGFVVIDNSGTVVARPRASRR